MSSSKDSAPAPIKKNEYPDTVERPVKSVSVPPTKRLDIDDLYDSKTGEIDLELLRTHFQKEGRLSERCANRLVNDGTEILRAEPTMIDIEAPITVCGDIGRVLLFLILSLCFE